jgi:LuxR family transcriptional regulator, maltose regulon positive regulatory protein
VESGLIVRRRLVERFDAAPPIVLVVAPSGYGKSAAVAHWLAVAARPSSLVEVEPFDDDPRAVWHQVVDALAELVVDTTLIDEARSELAAAGRIPAVARLLGRCVRNDPSVLSAACAPVLVVDGVESLVDASSTYHLARLIDEIHDLVHVVLVGRSAPSNMPLAAWFADGWLGTVDETDLGFTADEAAELARTMGRGEQEGRDAAIRYDGWPLAVRLAMRDDGRNGAAARPAVLLEQLVDSLIDRLPADVIDSAVALAVLDRFDGEIVDEVLLPDAGRASSAEVVAELRTQHLVRRDGERGGQLAFHPVVREALERRLEWSGADHRVSLHQRAAKAFERRGDLAAAHRHLVAAGDVHAARHLIVEPVLRAVDRGDVDALAGIRRNAPRRSEVADAGIAFDLAVMAFFAGERRAAHEWHRLGSSLLTDAAEPGQRLQQCSTAALLAKMDGRLADAAVHVEEFARLRRLGSPVGPLDRGFAIVAGLNSLARGDRAGAEREVVDARRAAVDRAVRDVKVPTMQMWLDVHNGAIAAACTRSVEVIEAAAQLGMLPDQNAFDAHLVSALASFHHADLETTAVMLRAIGTGFDRFAFDWNRILFATVVGRLRLARGDAVTATRSLVADTLPNLDDPDSDLVTELDAIEVRAALRNDDRASACTANERIESRGDRARMLPSAQLARVMLDPLASTFTPIDEWPEPERVEAELIRCGARRDTRGAAEVRRLLADAAVNELVSPFVEQRRVVSSLVSAEELERLHPRAATAIRASSPARRLAGTAVRPTAFEPLTAREASVLALLPTHLSNGEIGDQLYVSVNTVKSNLKAVYRKLHVTSRSEAVEVARRAGLL